MTSNYARGNIFSISDKFRNYVYLIKSLPRLHLKSVSMNNIKTYSRTTQMGRLGHIWSLFGFLVMPRIVQPYLTVTPEGSSRMTDKCCPITEKCCHNPSEDMLSSRA